MINGLGFYNIHTAHTRDPSPWLTISSWWVCKVWACQNHHPHGLCFLRFGMLKAWMINPSVDSIHVEEKYTAWVQSLRTDRYVTVRTLFWFVTKKIAKTFSFCNVCDSFDWGHHVSTGKNVRQVERLKGVYCRTLPRNLSHNMLPNHHQFWQWDFICSIPFVLSMTGLLQAKLAHRTHRPGARAPICSLLGLPQCWLGQAPNNPKAKLYKVLKEVIEDTSQGNNTSTAVLRFEFWRVSEV